MWLETLVLVAAALAVPVGAMAEDAEGDAYVRAETVTNRDTKWVLGTSRMERTLTLSGGRFLLTSFVNKAVGGPQEYVQGGTSPEFRATVNGRSVHRRDWRLEIGHLVHPAIAAGRVGP